MKIIHTSPKKIQKIDSFGIAGECLFFSNSVYQMTQSDDVFTYSLSIDEDKIIAASQLSNDEIIAEIAEEFECDIDTAESLLDGSKNEWEMDACDAEKSWWLQGKRGECAKAMGFEACEDEDEQGTVYIVPMIDRESDLVRIS